MKDGASLPLIQEFPQIDNYAISRQIGEGGYGFVFEATQTSTGQKVAIKMLKLLDNLDEQKRKYQIARFERETKLCADLSHPHIVKLLDKGYTDNDIPYAVFELIEGETLQERIGRQNGLSAEETGDLMGQVLDALSAAHGKGIIHRDLKPQNIMVIQNGLQPHVKILDFGIGAFTREFRTNDYQSLTLTREVLGTPAYSAPEQLRGEPPTVKSDLYAWGLTTIECLTGTPVMQGDSVAEVFQQQLNAANVPLPPAIAGHPLSDILRRVLNKNPRLRTSGADAIHQDFRKVNFSTLVGKIDAGTDQTDLGDMTGANSMAWKDLRSEKRQITVLAIKLTLEVIDDAVELDMETLDALQKDQLNLCKDIAVRFGGYIAGELSDNLMVYFGYPQVSDNDARRAGRTALELMSQVRRRSALLEAQHGVRLEIRISMHSGSVLSKPSQTPEGRIPNQTFNLLYSAAPGTILVSGDSKKLLDPYLEFESLPESFSSNLRIPPSCFSIVGERQTEALSFLRPWSANREMIGRDEEKNQVLAKWNTAQSGEGQAVILHGQAGIGKSKMIYEIKKQVRADGYLFRECRCLPEHQNNALFPFLDMLRNHWGIADVNDPATIISTLESELGAAGVELKEGLPILCSWLSVPLTDGYEASAATPDVQKQILFDLLGKSIQHIGNEDPFMLVLEDLHWLDPTGQEFVESQLAKLDGQACLFLMTTRPAFVPEWKQENLHDIQLEPLNQLATEELVEGVLEKKKIEAKALSYIDERADGVPLFIEELTRMLVEEGYLILEGEQYQLNEEADVQDIPTTLQDLLNARLDRLGLAKETAQVASTIGREFGYELLVRSSLRDEASVQADLDALMDADLVIRQRRVQDEGYIFRHALIRDAAYDGMLGAARKEHHLRIAETLKAVFPEVVEDNPYEVARHYAGGTKYTEAGGFGLKAVKKQVHLNSNMEALESSNTISSWIDMIPDAATKTQIQLELNSQVLPANMAVNGFGSIKVLEKAERTISLIDQYKSLLSEDDWQKVATEYSSMQKKLQWDRFIGFFHATGKRKEAEEAAQKILKYFEEDPNLEFEQGALGFIAHFFHSAGDLVLAEELYHRILEIYDPVKYPNVAVEFGWDPKSCALSHLSSTRLFLGYPDTALKLVEEAVEYSGQLNHPGSVRIAYIYYGIIGYLLRDRDYVGNKMKDFLIKYPDQEEAFLFTYITLFESWSKVDVDGMDKCVKAVIEAGQGYAISWYEPMVADGLVIKAIERLRKDRESEHSQALKDMNRAIEMLENTVARCEGNGEIWYLPGVKRNLGECYFGKYQSFGGSNPACLADAERMFREAVVDSQKMGTKWMEFEALVSHGEMLRDLGRFEEIRETLFRFTKHLEEGKSTLVFSKALNLLELD